MFILLNPNLILIVSCPQVELLMIVWRICGHCDAWDVAVIVVEERSGDQNCRNNKHLDFFNVNFEINSATDKVGVIPLKNFRIQRKLF